MSSRRFSFRATARQRLMASVAWSGVNLLPPGWGHFAIPSSVPSSLDFLRMHIHSLTENLLSGRSEDPEFFNGLQAVSQIPKASPTSPCGSSIPHSLVMALETAYNSPSRSLPSLVMVGSDFYDTSSYPRPSSLKNLLADVLSVDMKEVSSVRLRDRIKKVSPR